MGQWENEHLFLKASKDKAFFSFYFEQNNKIYKLSSNRKTKNINLEKVQSRIRMSLILKYLKNCNYWNAVLNAYLNIFLLLKNNGY